MFTKIKIYVIACMLFIAGGVMMGSTNEASASTCPNGCVAGYDGCFCHGWYWTLSEYNWDDNDKNT